MNVKGAGCVHCIENDGNNKNGGVGIFAKDVFLLNKKVKGVWRTGLCFHQNHFEKVLQRRSWKPAVDT